MTDRELLELAAKAAGLELDWDVPDGASPWVITGEGSDRGPVAPWNPLEDDGDALRLALSLSLDLVFDCYPAKALDKHRSSFRVRIWTRGWVKEEFASEEAKGAAVRRAIVRAAAAI